ncbi:hypothetical protein BJY21_003676 [Kineosphaera limosa]|uniref:Uncharacterized protein n=1 Tax=Kineosphaera limosa NBRC 100340 TaxID=1184609 RepID=K6VIC8_9MICO|nr:hypothetical protein [Kineosphaera limosa]NYE02492.1 hypothetical protein [Kineosphaera limosa]GAB95983.1 hypothetical protein KILIM_030_00250 [Kineosphaera limosa NBRC 100340]
MSDTDELVTRLQATAGPPAALDAGEVVEIAGRRRRRRVAAASSLAALVVVAGSVGVASQVLPNGLVGTGASSSQEQAGAPAAAQAGGGAVADQQVPAATVCPPSLAWGATKRMAPPVPVNPWLPEASAGDRLVPETVPTAAIVCRYESDEEALRDRPGPTHPPAPDALVAIPDSTLTGSATLTGALDTIPAELAGLPPATPGSTPICRAVAGPSVPYLLGLSYGDGGHLWVSTFLNPGNCSEATNGVFTSRAPLGPSMAEALESQVWPATPTAPTH